MEEQHKHEVKNIFMIRHGVALHNVMHDKVGHADPSLFDSSLIPEGRTQAEAMGQAFFQKKEYPVDLIVVSPLTRCLQTADCFARAGNFYKCPLPSTAVCHEGLREIFGIHQADRRRAKSELQAKWKNVVFDDNMSEHDELWHPSQRETWEELNARVVSFFDWLSQRPEQNIVIVSHGVWIECCLYAYSPETLTGGQRVYNCNVFGGKFDCVSKTFSSINRILP
uniref:Phosphoglycerate mutase-like protein n=1 Tax=Leptocylindrus danicus TaxID=163516 RepID=A0A7S2LD04_9STRA|mmetsp:Transcript_4058/g.5888  ORF Transcript_4058/g.5888 Transcript_4058/m.5888 type:complete len:224 (+) Transcript_4058:147-818(+)